MTTAAEKLAFLIFVVEDQKLAIRLDLVEQVHSAVEIIPLEGAPETILGLVNVHGAIIVVLNMRKKLNLLERPIELTDQLLIANLEERQFALLVDQVDGVVEVSIDTISALIHESLTPQLRINSGNESIIVQELADFLSPDEVEKLTQALQLAYTHQ
jgi:purine-binding chemotaxis protein CheW